MSNHIPSSGGGYCLLSSLRHSFNVNHSNKKLLTPQNGKRATR
jgi:hypothetical protein